MADDERAGSIPGAAADGLSALARRVAGAPDDDAARLALGRALVAAGDAAAAVPHFRHLAKAGPPRLEHWVPLVDALLRTGDLGGADRYLGIMFRSGVTGDVLDDLIRRFRAAVRATAGIRQLAPAAVTPGWPADRAQPAVLARIAITCPPRLDVAGLERLLARRFAVDLSLAAPGRDGAAAVADLIVRLVVALQRSAALPAFDAGLVLPDGEAGTFVLLVPAGEDGAALIVVDAIVSMVGRMIGNGFARRDWGLVADRLAEARTKLMDRLRQGASPTGNGLHFLRAAHDRGVPWRRYAGHAHQVGMGIHARWIDSSLTDRTPSIGVTLAQNKMATATILRRAGLPAPAHGRASSLDAAAKVAEQLGYPVVVKPISQDGGRGVAAGLEDAAALERAYAAAAEYREDVLVEKHVDGDDFRLVVMGGRVTWAIERVPGGVRGDGVATLAELLTALNADPRRGDGKGASLQRVDWDEEAAHLARRQGLTPESVPAAGRFVRLRRITNVARGGMPVPFPLERIHPDNLRLAERAAAALRLDLAGIDFITPDIGRPWYEAGGAINEVNARPSLGLITAGHLFGEIVDWMLGGGDGRIPIVAILGDRDGLAEPLARHVHALLSDAGRVAGIANADGAWIGETQVAWGDRRGEAGGALLLTDQTVEAAVLTVLPEGLEATGAPFDRCCVVVRLGGEGPPDPFEAGFVARARRAVVAPAEDMERLAGCGAARRIAVALPAGGDRVGRLAAAVAEGLRTATTEELG